MKLQTNNNLFTSTERQFNSEETQRIYKENISRLEVQLEEAMRRSQIFVNKSNKCVLFYKVLIFRRKKM